MKASRQRTTKIDKHYLFEELEPQYQDAVMYLFGGWRYERIAKILGVKYATVRTWFQKNGICRRAYDELVKDHAKQNRKLVKRLDKRIQEALPDMLEVIINSAKCGNWLAAQSILDRGGFGPVARVETKIEEFDDKAHVKEIIMEIREKIKTARENDRI